MSAPSRVLNTVTVAQHDSAVDMRDADLSDLEAVAAGEYDFDPDATPGADDSFDPDHAYVNSKLALLLFTYELADRLAGTGVTVTSFNPGLVGATDISRHMPLRQKLFFQVAGLAARVTPISGLATQEEAGETLVHHGLDQDLPEGAGTFFDQRDRTDPGPRAHDGDLRGELWRFTANLADCAETISRR
jgi:NAD(P)-dependent dehydrogenase (short-subunit alcohol dehydrogenase family)